MDNQSVIITTTGINDISSFASYSQVEYCTIVRYIKTKENAIEPTRGSAEAAGYDLYNPGEEVSIAAHSTVVIDTGIAVELPRYTFGAVFARSGLATKQGLRPANCVGVVDSDYRGSIGVAIHNDTNETKIIAGGDRIAQLVVIPYCPIKFEEADFLDTTDRGNGGFGSTGK